MKMARARGPGRYTATQTGARKLAELRDAMRRQKALGKATQSTEDFEDYIGGKGSQ